LRITDESSTIRVRISLMRCSSFVFIGGRKEFLMLAGDSILSWTLAGSISVIAAELSMDAY
jgi:hypothetical protein